MGIDKTLAVTLQTPITGQRCVCVCVLVQQVLCLRQQTEYTRTDLTICRYTYTIPQVRFCFPLIHAPAK